MAQQPQKTSSQQNIVFFAVLFTACIVGSVGIFIFAVGLETGDRIVNFTMKTLLENVLLVFILLGVFNLLVYGIYVKNKKKGRV